MGCSAQCSAQCPQQHCSRGGGEGGKGEEQPAAPALRQRGNLHEPQKKCLQSYKLTPVFIIFLSAVA